jgi:hypothetical protein
VPTSPAENFYINEPASWIAETELIDDTKGVSWSEHCGYASLTYSLTSPAISQDGQELLIEATLVNQVTLSDTTTSSLSVSVTQTDLTNTSNPVPTATNSIMINIEPNCEQFNFEEPADMTFHV